MPAVGVVLPTHKELMDSEPGRLPKWLPTQDLLDLAATWGPKDSPWTYEMLHAVFSEQYNSTSISPTFLLGGDPRAKVIERKKEYIVTADDFYMMYRGTMVHQALELAARPNSIAEVKFFADVNGTEVRAIPDLITDGIWDYKVTDNPPLYYPYKSHRRQVEANRFIVNNALKWEKHGEPYEVPFDVRRAEFEHLTLVYLGPKGPKPMTIEKKQPFTTPKGRVTEKNQPYVASDEEVLEWLEPLIEMFNIALDAFPKWPKGLEKMSIPDTSGSKRVFPFGGAPEWRCQGKPFCNLPTCTAKRYPAGLMWDPEGTA